MDTSIGFTPQRRDSVEGAAKTIECWWQYKQLNSPSRAIAIRRVGSREYRLGSDLVGHAVGANLRADFPAQTSVATRRKRIQSAIRLFEGLL